MPNIYGTPAVDSAPVLSSIVDADTEANAVAEDASIGAAVGITAYAEHVGYTVTYSLSDSSGGKFAIGPTTGIVTVAAALDYAAATSHSITVLATSTSGDTTSQAFTVNVIDVVPLYPTPVAIPTSQYAEISISQPGYLESVAFGTLDTNVIRIGDSTKRHAYATQQCWNADMSRLILNYSGSYPLLNGTTYAVINASFDPGYQACFFDPVDPDILWGHDGNAIKRYDFGTGTSDTFTLSDYTAISIGGGEGSISNDGRYIAVVGTTGTDRHVAVFDTTTETLGTPIVFTGWTGPGGDIDNCHISQSGTYVIVASYRSGDEGHKVYNRATGSLLYTYDGGAGSTDFPGHMDCGYRTDGTECFVRLDEDGNLVSVKLSDGTARIEVPAAASSWSNHISCRNINRPGYAYISMFYAADQTSKYLYREIFALRLSGAGTIERFGQGVFPADAEYSTQAHACASPNGSRVIFASGWGTTTTRPYVCGVDA